MIPKKERRKKEQDIQKLSTIKSDKYTTFLTYTLFYPHYPQK